MPIRSHFQNFLSYRLKLDNGSKYFVLKIEDSSRSITNAKAMCDLLMNKKDLSKYKLEEIKMAGYNEEDIDEQKYKAAKKELEDMKKYGIPKFHGKGVMKEEEF